MASQTTTRSLALIMATILLVTGCSNNKTEETKAEHSFGYVLDDYLINTNVTTGIGFSSNIHQLVGRIYPGAFVNGPEGQRIPNTDLVEARALPGAPMRVEYQIADKAVYSDGQPVTCDSFLLAQVAATSRPLFDSYNPLMDQIDTINCQPGNKTATVVFKGNFGPRWRYLFSGGTLLPAHAIAAKANMSLADLNTALHNRDLPRLQQVAQVWNSGFDLGKFDPALQVSSGPFLVKSVAPDGAVTLVRNDKYYGEPAVLDKLIVYPKGTDLHKLADAGNLHIAEADSKTDTNWIDRNDNKNPYIVKANPGVLAEHLILASAGVLADQADRQAFAACVDQAAVAQASAKESGVEVQPVALRTIRPGDSIATHLKEISDQHLGVNIDQAKKLTGKTIRIGYFAPDKRKMAMVAAIKASCEPAGITILDVSNEAASVSNLPFSNRRQSRRRTPSTRPPIQLPLRGKPSIRHRSGPPRRKPQLGLHPHHTARRPTPRARAQQIRGRHRRKHRPVRSGLEHGPVERITHTPPDNNQPINQPTETSLETKKFVARIVKPLG